MLMVVAVAAGLAVTTGSARADWGGYVPAGGAQASPALPPPGAYSGPGTLFGLGAGTPGQPPAQYGLNPCLRKAFRLGSGYGCASCGKGGYGGHMQGGYGGPSYGGAPPYTPVMQGTLVFPQHPFVRSPRDYFMTEPHR